MSGEKINLDDLNNIYGGPSLAIYEKEEKYFEKEPEKNKDQLMKLKQIREAINKKMNKYQQNEKTR